MKWSITLKTTPLDTFLKILGIVSGSNFLCSVCKYVYKTYKLNKCGCKK